MEEAVELTLEEWESLKPGMMLVEMLSWIKGDMYFLLSEIERDQTNHSRTFSVLSFSADGRSSGMTRVVAPKKGSNLSLVKRPTNKVEE